MCLCFLSFFLETRIGVREKNLPSHGNDARLFSCDLDVEKASVVKTASERNLVKRRLFRGL